MLELHCYISGICEPPMSSSLFSNILFWIINFVAILLNDHNKFCKSVHGTFDLCTDLLYLMRIHKNHPECPFKCYTHSDMLIKYKCSQLPPITSAICRSHRPGYNGSFLKLPGADGLQSLICHDMKKKKQN